ncbi:P-type conjugative transfer protein VirB9 [Taylorella equigenitalis]|uniref:Conjugal transfer-like protein n=2 Tax=Taylorella equigenitalis TaxID=29575 RepID=A0A654KFA0_TAYEM|nr:P-type conjugative transfer protein VirB9 [Taylorella equigenitalis]ADU91097.1 Conjugal transfer-like protein [Taylorella equigenitalis MCE9]AFN36201.1 putative Type IV secretion protein [Taylorella equigenitalis ATCC 35865]ASY39604.1 P-type conjugative transfer protein VirB9 [Taylorella equigenitalis]WDU55932.1 P-type conjugative transfer protein VirB9 [Taylorella equigenitalis]VEG31970.1 Type IV secretion system protein virB9 precursor [Taylorella equigenitalis ATCC 35865]
MKYFLSTFVAFILLIAGNAYALVIPQGGKGDGRIQTAFYTPTQVYNIKASIGRAVLIQFEEDEYLDEEMGLLGMGDATAWNVAVKANNVLFKPLSENPDTNLIVNTNKRTYAFELSVLPKGKQMDTYVLRFTYPKKQMISRDEELRDQVSKEFANKSVNVKRMNQNYWGYGDDELAPTALYDDGRFTYFEFDNNKDLPNIYKIMPDGTEMLLNFTVKGNTLIVHQLNKEFYLRLGTKVLGIVNKGFDVNGRFNYHGTGNETDVRVLREKN